VLVAVALLVLLVFQLRERAERAKTAEPELRLRDRSESDSGGFPPPFPDVRPDLSKRADYVEVCGVGRIPGELDAKFWREYVSNGHRLLESAAASRATSGKDLDRALALYVTAIPVGSADPPKDNDETPNTNERALQPLARVAVGSRDPETYALGFHRCGSAEACAQFSSARWAQLEPDNAVPWLYEAESALRRNDPAGVDIALQRASKARTLEPYMATPLRLIDTPEIRSAPPLQASAAVIALTGMAAAMPFPNLQLVMEYCTATAKGAAQRKQVCSDLAEVFTERSTALLGMAIGARIAEQAGWPNERVAAIRARVEALQRVQTMDPKEPYSCAAMERGHRYFADFGRLGEVAAAQRALTAGQQNSK